jgi:hypothetical protein
MLIIADEEKLCVKEKNILTRREQQKQLFG